MEEKFIRPWGWYENIIEETGYKVKRLFVESGQKISLQYHEHRSEHWIVVQGSGKVELDGNIKDVGLLLLISVDVNGVVVNRVDVIVVVDFDVDVAVVVVVRFVAKNGIEEKKTR